MINISFYEINLIFANIYLFEKPNNSYKKDFFKIM